MVITMLGIPIINRKSTKETREDYLHELKRAGADRVFLCPSNPFGRQPELDNEISHLAENIRYYRENGLEVGVWINGFGHGGDLVGPYVAQAQNFTKLRGLDGGEAGDSFCPLDPAFRACIADLIRRIAEAGPSLIMIDDDLRISMHGAVGIGCACPLHLAMLSERLGREITREELSETLFAGKADELRKTWLEVQAESVRIYCRDMRAAVDAVDPAIRLGHCACLTTWDVDGIDSIEISRILAGGTKPFLRLIGAAYWANMNAFGTKGLGTIIELERMQAEWCRQYAPEIEIFSEGDVYPRPRYVVPSSYVEGFDQALLASGALSGILKYMIDYCHAPLYETGYIDRHEANAPLRREISAYFADGDCTGVTLFEPLHTIADLDCTELHAGDLLNKITRPALKLTSCCAIPTTYVRATGRPVVLFDEAAKYADDELLSHPLILDITSAKLLTEKGMDVGLCSAVPADNAGSEYFLDWDETIPTGAVRGCYRAELKPSAQVLSTFRSGNAEYPAAYLYENASGQRFFVYTCRAMLAFDNAVFLRCYPRQKQFFDAFAWLSGKPLPVSLPRQPGLYALCKEAGGRLTAGLWNFWIDPIVPKDITLDKAYEKITFFGGAEGVLDGNVVHLTSMIPAYGFAGFAVE